MKITEAIDRLSAYREKLGDVDVYVVTEDYVLPVSSMEYDKYSDEEGWVVQFIADEEQE